MNNEPKPAVSRNHRDSGSSEAVPPAIARNRKPDATIARSSTTTCLKEKQYAAFITTYRPNTSAVPGLHSTTASATAATPSTGPRVHASLTGTTPEAIGRLRLVG